MSIPLSHIVKALQRAGIAVLAVIAAMLIRKYLLNALEHRIVWVTFYPAVVVASVVGGWFCGVLAAAGSCLVALYAWPLFVAKPFIKDYGDWLGLYAYFVNCVMISIVSEMMLRARARANAARELAELANRRSLELLEQSQSSNLMLQAAHDEISGLYEKNRELDTLKSQFFANVSHELRTPLTLILGPVRKFLSDDTLNPDQRTALEVVHRNAQLLYRHVSDLLDVAKIEAGGVHLTYSEVDLAHLARVTASLFEILANEKNMTYTLNIPDSLYAQVDPEKCQRIMLNLLSNAFKFTPADGSISMALEQNQENIIIMIQDKGPGVPEKMRDFIFEPFRQVEGDADRRFGGTGLGLSIVKEFVELHGGRVSVGDAPGGGALFNVRLPVKAPAGTELSTARNFLDEQIVHQSVDELCNHCPQSRGSDLLDAPLILVVEDNVDMNIFIVDTLRRYYRVETAFDGVEGVEKAVNLNPDLIVSDVMMPQMSGDVMLHELRNHNETGKIPVLFLTAKADDALKNELVLDGAKGVLHKPFSVEELLACVHRIITDALDTKKELFEIKQQQLEELNRTLEGEVQSALAQLRQKDQMLIQQSRLAAMGEMLNNIAHQWRQPLNSMGLLLDSIKDSWEYNKLDGEYLESSLMTAHNLLQNMSATIHDFSNFFRPDKDKKAFSAIQQIKSAVQMVVSSYRSQNIHFTVDTPSDCMIMGFHNEYSQVLLNLFANAKDAIQQSAKDSGEIMVSLFQDEGFGCVAVRDNGGGIPEQLLTRIFEPYFSTKDSGTGIGLYMSKMIIERNMQGTIEARNIDGGAEFLVKCPLAEGKTS